MHPRHPTPSPPSFARRRQTATRSRVCAQGRSNDQGNGIPRWAERIGVGGMEFAAVGGWGAAGEAGICLGEGLYDGGGSSCDGEPCEWGSEKGFGVLI